MKSVTVIGAGFSGLTLAYYLSRLGFRVDVHERNESPGGLISTQHTEWGHVETAANALLSDVRVEKLFAQLGVEFAERGPAVKKKYIYWDRPKRWPLSWRTTGLGFELLLRAYFLKDSTLKPKSGETVFDWTVRIMNLEFCERLVAPALQGIFAGDVRRMSARLIFETLFENRLRRGHYKGSVSPSGGMGTLMTALVDNLRKSGCSINFRSKWQLPETVTSPLILATSAWNAADILSSRHPETARLLASAESLPLVRVSAFFAPDPEDLDGFGCLFPVEQGFSSLGVVFESSIFPERSKYRLENWILGGAKNSAVVAWGDEQITEMVLKDRERLTGKKAEPKKLIFTRWQRALPHYTVDWENTLKRLRVEPPLYLHGNYLGQLGLGRILNRSRTLAKEIKRTYG